jgi:hypothetical protein
VPLNRGDIQSTVTRNMDAFQTSWQEIQRLMEIKYLIGGWDFQIAVVCCH